MEDNKAINELKAQASPMLKLEQATKEQNTRLDVHTDLLLELCESKKQQLKNDSKWRLLWQQQKEEAKKQKRIATISSLMALFFTGAAFYLNVIKLDEESAFIRGLAAFFDVMAGVL
jgi:PBP1b-binding outer membrane lipoprotein LpoB